MIASSAGCVVCASIDERAPPGEETKQILVVLLAGHPLDAIRRQLCFAHRRQIEAAARLMPTISGA